MGLQGFGLNGVAVHVERGGSVLHAEGHLVPAQVQQGFHPLPGENAAHQVCCGVYPPGTQGQAGIGAIEVYRELRVALLIRYLEEVDGVSQGSLLQCQGEDQGELLRQAMRKHLIGGA